MSPTTPPPPENNNADNQTGYSIKPLIFGSSIMCALLMGSFWVYIEHPEWLDGSNPDDERIEKILEANPELTLEDLEADAQSGDLSFWLRTEPTNLSQSERKNNKKKNEPDPLETFMKKQRQEAKNKQKNSSSNNPLLNFSSLGELANEEGSNNKSNSQIGQINLDPLSLSTPLDRMLRGETGNHNLTPLEAEILSLQQITPIPTKNTLQSRETDISSPPENITIPNNSNSNLPVNQTARDPYNLLPNTATYPDNNSLGLSSTRQRSTTQLSPTQLAPNQTTRRGTTNPTLNGVGVNGTGINSVNGVIPTTPVIPSQNSRRAIVSPRVSTPALTTTPTLNNTDLSIDDPYSRSQPARVNQPVQVPRPANPNNRIGGGEINTFSDPYGTGR
ncbi:MAG: hypothetical protein J7647_32950 [Cyanobacteria bacterium SBLK]|nr:hypothetical protein [Cyanobacteria bacterium SBLK]